MLAPALLPLGPFLGLALPPTPELLLDTWTHPLCPLQGSSA